MKTYHIELDANDLGQLLEGLEARAEAWEKTGSYLTDGDDPLNPFFMPEECHQPHEAFSIAEHYRSIIRQISEQMEGQG